MTQVENLSIDTLLKNLTRDHDYGAIITDVNGNLLRRIFAVKVLLSLLLILMLVACDDSSSSDSSSDSPNDSSSSDELQCSSYSLQIQKFAKEIQHDSKLTINVEINNDGKLAKDNSEISLAITCGEHKVFNKEQKATDGKAIFADIAVSGNNFDKKCLVNVTTEMCALSAIPRKFTVMKHPPQTSLAIPEELPTPPPLTIGNVTVGQPIDITVPTTFSGKVKLQPSFVDPLKKGEEKTATCPGYFLIHHDGDQLAQVLTAGVAISANNGKLEGLVLIKKSNAPICEHELVITTTDNKIQQKNIEEGSQNFGGSLENNKNKLALSYSGTPPAAIFFTTAGEGNLWTKYTGTMSSPAISTLAYSQSSSAALVKSNSGNWSYIGN